MGWFLIKRFVDLFRVCYVISRDHSSTFFLVNLQETNLSKEKHSSKGYLFSYQIFDSLDILISAELSLVLKKFKLYQENWLEEEFILMNLCKHKRWKAHRVIAKQQSKRELTYPVCLHAAGKYEKVESINTQNDYKTASEKWIDKKKTDLFSVFCKCVNVFKFQENKFKIVQKNF